MSQAARARIVCASGRNTHALGLTRALCIANMNPALSIAEVSRAGGRELAGTGEWRPGPVYTFVPAHGGCKVGAIQLSLARTWTEDLELAVLLANFAPRLRPVQ